MFRLYVAAGAPNSLRAIANLRQLCDQYLPNRYRIEIVNVLDEPRRALEDQILVTPTLVKLSPPPSWQMAGDLSATSKILFGLGIDEEPGDE